MLIITGSGRSGTSFLAEYCRRIGYSPGGYWLPKDINAGMEHPFVVEINEKIVQRIRNNQPITDDIFKYSILSISNKVIKDPRFLGCSGQVIEVWRRFRQDFNVILLQRDAKAVAKSFKMHPDHFTEQCCLPEEELANRVQKGVDEFVSKLETLNIPFQIFTFPCFLEQFEEIYQCLNQFGNLPVSKIRARTCWNNLVDMRKVRAANG